VLKQRRHLLALAGGVVGRERAEDAVQEGSMRAWRALRGGAVPTAPPSWLGTIVFHAAVDLVREKRPDSPLQPSADGSAAEVAEQREEFRRVVERIGELPPTQREAIVAFAFEGKAYREIAAAQESSEGSVKMSLNRARRGLRAAA